MFRTAKSELKMTDGTKVNVYEINGSIATEIIWTDGEEMLVQELTHSEMVKEYMEWKWLLPETREGDWTIVTEDGELVIILPEDTTSIPLRDIESAIYDCGNGISKVYGEYKLDWEARNVELV